MPDLVRLATAGSVDDGKSTLIGRLLYDSKALMADQVDDAEVDLSRLTDGLRAEREQGITIDVAYRFFATPRRSFIIADTPGHIRYTRNMVTGASTADLAVVLVDARNGVRRAVAPARLPVRAARDPPHRRLREQDGPRSTGTRTASARSSATSPSCCARSACRTAASSRSRRCTATTSSSRVDANAPLVRRAADARATSSSSRSRADRNLDDVRLPVQWVVRAHRLPRLRRPGGERRPDGPATRCVVLPQRRAHHDRRHRHATTGRSSGASRRCR